MKLHEPAAKVQGGRLFRLLLPGVAILIFGIAVLLGLMVYKVSYPGVVAEAVNPLHYLLPSLELWIPSSKGPDISAWWIPGLKHAPGIILAPGYGMNRADALSLAVALNQRGFNILIYAQRGNGASPREASTLGLREAEDMADAVRFLQRQARERSGTYRDLGRGCERFCGAKNRRRLQCSAHHCRGQPL